MFHGIILAQYMWLHCSSIISFVCQKYAGIISELCLSEIGKESSLGCCRSGCSFIFSGIHHPCYGIPCLLLMI